MADTPTPCLTTLLSRHKVAYRMRMTSPRSFDGVGYHTPSFFSDTPIYDSLVAERGVPQIAPINVPAALPPSFPSPYEQPRYSGGYESSSSNLPALVSRPALGPGPSSYQPPQAPPQQYAAAPQIPHYGAPQPYVPGQRMPAPTQVNPGMPGAPPGAMPRSGGFRRGCRLGLQARRHIARRPCLAARHIRSD